MPQTNATAAALVSSLERANAKMGKLQEENGKLKSENRKLASDRKELIRRMKLVRVKVKEQMQVIENGVRDKLNKSPNVDENTKKGIMDYVKAGFATALGVILAFAVVDLAVGAIGAMDQGIQDNQDIQENNTNTNGGDENAVVPNDDGDDDDDAGFGSFDDGGGDADPGMLFDGGGHKKTTKHRKRKNTGGGNSGKSVGSLANEDACVIS